MKLGYEERDLEIKNYEQEGRGFRPPAMTQINKQEGPSTSTMSPSAAFVDLKKSPLFVAVFLSSHSQRLATRYYFCLSPSSLVAARSFASRHHSQFGSLALESSDPSSSFAVADRDVDGVAIEARGAGVIDAELTIVLSSISMACKQIASLVQDARFLGIGAKLVAEYKGGEIQRLFSKNVR